MLGTEYNDEQLIEIFKTCVLYVGYRETKLFERRHGVERYPGIDEFGLVVNGPDSPLPQLRDLSPLIWSHSFYFVYATLLDASGLMAAHSVIRQKMSGLNINSSMWINHHGDEKFLIYLPVRSF